jgi:signal transduction histidine kinase
MSYLLKKKHADQTDIAEGLEKIEQAVQDSLKIFNFARIYEQLGVEELKYVNVENSFNEAATLCSGLNFTVINDCHGLSLFADSFLVQLFCNLIDNSRKHGKAVSTVQVSYEISQEGSLRLIYEDDGVGISPENKSRLFSEGFSTGGSSGFGLFLIRKMMAVYDWMITEAGESGKGVKFVITIPNKNKNGQANYILANNSNC